jgi:hypothetical protein
MHNAIETITRDDTIVDEAGRYGPDERDQMYRVTGKKVIYPRTEEAETPVYAYTPHKRDYLKQGWEHNDRIDRIFNGSQADLPQTPEEAIMLIRDRFGCVFHMLPETLQRNEQVLLAAAVESSGHTLKQAPKDAVEALPPAFFVAAIQAGARAWVLQLPGVSDAVRNSEDVQKAVTTQQSQDAERRDALQQS